MHTWGGLEQFGQQELPVLKHQTFEHNWLPLQDCE